MPDDDFFLLKCFFSRFNFIFPVGRTKTSRHHFNYDQFIVFCVVAIFPQMSFMCCRM